MIILDEHTIIEAHAVVCSTADPGCIFGQVSKTGDSFSGIQENGTSTVDLFNILTG